MSFKPGSPPDLAGIPLYGSAYSDHRRTPPRNPSDPDFLILGTPEAESYFETQSKKRAHESQLEELIMNVEDLTASSNLTVKTPPPNLASSYENIYDNQELEKVYADPNLNASELNEQLGDKFDTKTYKWPTKTSSYENLYDVDRKSKTPERLAAESLVDEVMAAALKRTAAVIDDPSTSDMTSNQPESSINIELTSSVKPAVSFQSKEFTEIFGLSPTDESHRHHSSEDDSGPSYLVHFPSDDSIDELFKSSSGATSQVLTHTVTGIKVIDVNQVTNSCRIFSPFYSFDIILLIKIRLKTIQQYIINSFD